MYLGINKNTRGVIILTIFILVILISYSYFDAICCTTNIFTTTAVIMQRQSNVLVQETQYRTVIPSKTAQMDFSRTSSLETVATRNYSMSAIKEPYRNQTMNTYDPDKVDWTLYASKLMERKFNFSDTKTCVNTIKIQHSSHLSTRAIQTCVSNYRLDYRKGLGIWVGNRAEIRWTHHSYLTNNSVVLDIGGNTGLDAENIISMFHPRLYIILEPVRFYYEHLITKFSEEKCVIVMQFGAGAKNAKHNVSIAGKDGDATSIFTKWTVNKTTTIQIFNITEIFIALHLKCLHEFDLLTINCEGCEFEVLEELGKTDVLKFIKNIQFATHTTLHYLKDPISRYCKIQGLLSKTHTLSYQYKFFWESWKRKDLLFENLKS